MILTQHPKVSDLIFAGCSLAIHFLPTHEIALATVQQLPPTVPGLVWLGAPSLATVAGNTERCLQGWFWTMNEGFKGKMAKGKATLLSVTRRRRRRRKGKGKHVYVCIICQCPWGMEKRRGRRRDLSPFLCQIS